MQSKSKLGIKTVWKRISIALIIAFLLIPITAEAASVSNVTIKRSYSSATSKQWATLYGKSSNGKIQWKYKTSKAVGAELESVSYITKGNNVFIIDDDTYIRLNKNTGKVLAKKKISKDIFGAALAIDSKNNLYCIGYYGSVLFKINPKGKVTWKHKFSDKYYWPYKIKISSKNIKVFFYGDSSPKSATIKIK